MNIDWSKAPEGTEAFCEGYWLKKDENGDYLVQPINNGWGVPDFKPWKQNGFTRKQDQFWPAKSAEELAEFLAWKEIDDLK